MTTNQIAQLTSDETDLYMDMWLNSSDYYHFCCMVRNEKLIGADLASAKKSAFKDYLLELI